jgi:phage terminase large subunit
MLAASREDRELIALQERCQKDLLFHLEHVQGIETLEEYQKRIVRAVNEHERVAVSACHDVGKTFLMARIALAIGSSFPNVKIITTAPTMTMVEMLLWSEIRAGYKLSKYPLGGRMLTTKWDLGPEWFAIGLSPKEDAEGGDGAGGQGKGSNFQGYHSEFLVLLFDEATGVPPKRFIQAEGMMTSANVKWVCIANPTSRSVPFFKCMTSPAWHKERITCFDSPNLRANGITDLAALKRELTIYEALPTDEAKIEHVKRYKVVQARLLTLKWVIEKAAEWGLDHPLFVSKVLGEFPREDSNVLMPLGVVERAQLREVKPAKTEILSLGIDCARFGIDRSILTLLHGVQEVGKRILTKQDTGHIAGEAIAMVRPYLDADHRPQDIAICIDGTGIGAGVVDRLNEAVRDKTLPRGINIIEANFGEGFKYLGEPDSRDRKEAERLYLNRKAKMFVELGKDLREKLCLLQDSAYLEELPTIIYRFDSKGRFVIEGKEDYKKRTGRGSPDHADSLALANEGRKFRSMVGLFGKQNRQGSGTLAPGLNSGDLS